MMTGFDDNKTPRRIPARERPVIDLGAAVREDLRLTRQLNELLASSIGEGGVGGEPGSGPGKRQRGASSPAPDPGAAKADDRRRPGFRSTRYSTRRLFEGRQKPRARAAARDGFVDGRAGADAGAAAQASPGDRQSGVGALMPITSARRQKGCLNIYCPHPAAAQRVRLESQRILKASGCGEISIKVSPVVRRVPAGRSPEPPKPPEKLGPRLRKLAGCLPNGDSARVLNEFADSLEGLEKEPSDPVLTI